MKVNTRSVRFCQNILKNPRGSNVLLRIIIMRHIRTRFFSKLYHFFLQKTTFFSKPNSALFDRSHSSRRQSDTMSLSRRDWLFAPTIRYQFKRRLFSRRPSTGPHLWAGPHSRLQRLANCVSFSFNLLVTNQRCLADLMRRSLLMGTVVCTPI